MRSYAQEDSCHAMGNHSDGAPPEDNTPPTDAFSSSSLPVHPCPTMRLEKLA